MIVCNKCGRSFASDDDLAKILNVQVAADDEVFVLYDGQDFDEAHGIVFDGCPDCLTDAYLMDKEDKDATTSD